MSATTAQESRSPRRRGTALSRAWPSLVAGAVVLGSLVWLALQAGGYFAPDYLVVGAVVFAAGGGILLAHVPTHRLSTESLVGLGALGSYAAWTGLSSSWSPTPDAALEAMQRDIVHTGVFGLALLAAGSGRYARHLVWGVLAALSVLVGAALLSRLYPGLVEENLELGALTPYRVSYPWTYWNTAGTVATMGGVLATGLAADPRARVPLRAVAAGAAVAMFVVMYLSFSRGAWLALFVALAVLILLGAHRGSLLLTAGIVGGATALAILRLRGYPAITDDPTAGSGQSREGREYGLQLLVLCGAAVAAQGVIAAGRASDSVMAGVQRVKRPVGIAAAVVIGLFAVVTYGLRAGDIEGWTAERGNDTADWVSVQWDEFLRPATLTAEGSARLVTARGSRSEVYRVAIDGFRAEPLLGEGGGSFEQRWIRERKNNEFVRDAHSLELETLSELGLVGFLILMAFLGSLAAAAARSRRQPGTLPRSQVAAVGAACSVWVFHSAVDWDWEMTAFTGLVLVLAATLYPYGRRRRRAVPVFPYRRES